MVYGRYYIYIYLRTGLCSPTFTSFHITGMSPPLYLLSLRTLGRPALLPSLRRRRTDRSSWRRWEAACCGWSLALKELKNQGWFHWGFHSILADLMIIQWDFMGLSGDGMVSGDGMEFRCDFIRGFLRRHKMGIFSMNRTWGFVNGTKDLSYLVGGWPSPLKNRKVTWDYDIPNWMENKKCSKPPSR